MPKEPSLDRRRQPSNVPDERRSGQDRRRDTRLRLTLETAVPVLVRAAGVLQWGIARNISEGGMLIELAQLPGIGCPVEIQIAGIYGSTDAPEPATLHGEVRHHVAWNYRSEQRGRGLSAVGVRFTSAPAKTQDWVPGQTLH